MTAVPPYITALNKVEITGWAKLGSIWISVEPLRDDETGGYAHLTYEGALAAVEDLGARLPRADDIIALHALGIELRPVTLPTDAMIDAAGVPHTTAAIDAFRNANMCGEAWARLHDYTVLDQLAEIEWDETRPIANAGKHWVCGAPPGRAYLMGWWNGSRWWQPPPAPGSHGPHDRAHHDYATTTIAVRESEP